MRALLVLIATAALPFSLWKYNFGMIVSFIALVLPVGALFALIFRQSYPAPVGAFCCPFVPFVPLAGVLLNVYLAVNLTPWAWIRLVVLWTLLIAYYVWSEVKRQRGGGTGSFRECLLSPPSHGVVSCGMGDDSLRRRRGSHPLSTSAGKSSLSSSLSSSTMKQPLLADEHV